MSDKTCKDCEHYEFYDGHLHDTDIGEGMVMYCRSLEKYRHVATFCACSHFTPKKAYAERQAEWVEKNGIKVGDKVRILR